MLKIINKKKIIIKNLLLMKNKSLKNLMPFLLLELTQHQIILKWWFMKLLVILKSKKKLESKYKSIWAVMTTVSKIWKISNISNFFKKKQLEFMALEHIYFLDTLWLTTIWMGYLLKKELLLTLWVIATIFLKSILKTLNNSDLRDGRANVKTYLHL